MKKNRSLLCIMLAAVICLGMSPINAMAAENTEDTGVAVLEMVLTEGLTLDITDENVFGGLYDLDSNGLMRTVMLTNCAIRMGYVDDTYLHVEFLTGCSDKATEIGIKDIKIQKQVGIFWTTIATSEGGSATNTSGCSGSSDCYGVVKGETYRVSCTHYAYVGGTYYSLDNVTAGHKFN